MSFEAVPCMFKSRDETGKEAPKWGFIIRPSGSNGPGQVVSAPSTSTSGGPVNLQQSPVKNPSQSHLIPSSIPASSIPSTMKLTPVGSVPASAVQPVQPISAPKTLQLKPAFKALVPAGANKQILASNGKVALIPASSITTTNGVATSVNNGQIAVKPKTNSKNGPQKCPVIEPSTSAAPLPNMPSTSYRMNDLQEDLNSIEMNELMPTNGGINTEEYLGGQGMPMPNTNAHGYYGGYEGYYQHCNMQTAGTSQMQPLPSTSMNTQMNPSMGPSMHPNPSINPPIHHYNAPYDCNVYPSTSYQNNGYYNQWQAPVQHPHQRIHQVQQQVSTSPDSGIQSIDGSPPSMAFTPPLSGEAFSVQALPYDPAEPTPAHQPPSASSMLPPLSNQPCAPEISEIQTNVADQHADLSDMPTLIRADEETGLTNRPGPSTEAEAPILDSSPNSNRSRSASARPSSSMNEDVFQFLATMGPNEIISKLKDHWPQEKIQEFEKSFMQITKPSAERSKSTIKDTTNSEALHDLQIKPIQHKKERYSNVREENNENHEETGSLRRKRIKEYRRNMIHKLNLRMKKMVDEVADKFSRCRVKFRPIYRLTPAFCQLNWRRIEERAKKPHRKLGRVTQKWENFQIKTMKKEDMKRRHTYTESSRSAFKSIKRREDQEKLKRKMRHQSEERGEEMMIKKRGRKRKRIEEDGKKIESSKPNPENTLDVVPMVRKRKRSKNMNKDEYIKIRCNVMIDQPAKLSDPDACECEPEAACLTRNCPHRALNIECTQSTCSIHYECRNRRMLSNEAVHQLQMFDTASRGRGIKTTVHINPGQFVCEYVGEVMKLEAYQMRHLLRSVEQPRFGVQLTPNFVVDATQKGNIARFINHSCQPNCEMQRWQVGANYRLGIFAKRAIEEGEELTYDYRLFARMEPEQECRCGEARCQGVIPSQMPPRPILQEPEKLSRDEVKIVRKNRLFLVRNLKKVKGKATKSTRISIEDSSELLEFLLNIYEDIVQHAESKEKLKRSRISQLKTQIQKVFKLKDDELELIQCFDHAIKAWINTLQGACERRAMESLKSHYLHIKKTRDLAKHMEDQKSAAAKELVKSFSEDRKRTSLNGAASKRQDTRVLSADADLTYMDKGLAPVGSYDNDLEAVKINENGMEEEGNENDSSDCVRCICGMFEDDGEMVECDRCKFWLHADCVNYDKDSSDDYECDFCSKKLKSAPKVDIILNPQPDQTLPNCTYYRTLVTNRGLQVRINEAVYVEKEINEDYKVILKQLLDQTPRKRSKKSDEKRSPIKEYKSKHQDKKEWRRSDLRCFRIERLFTGPNGEKFVFGCYYARPHETFCDSNRLFHKNELFWTPLFNTLPLDAVVGRCLVLEPSAWSEGRPKEPYYKEDDVFVCEYQIDKTQRTFTKMPVGSHYPPNRANYVFNKFNEPRKLKRDFTPFVLTNAEKKPDRHETRDRCLSSAKELNMENLRSIVANIKKQQKKRRSK
ncbi:unnamed protein product [Bursaphelenchus xylophilus]|uniref:(pine wood nematode) hypothetical protein n=1 Tax=Bursaphelenchus xylophilus TaxID=6326 RepID=A0A1I7RVI8_BURXY|nr:unnamed protein product [Bursaphelenchus xylophilus]CAG9081737.1 unnamed protein product [Bursaphelenchus xylophilus]